MAPPSRGTTTGAAPALVNTICDPLPGRSARPSRRRRFITSRPVHPKLTDVAPQQGGRLAPELPPASTNAIDSSDKFLSPRHAVLPIRRVGRLGFGYILHIDGDDTHAALMGGNHHAQGLILAHAEFRLQ